MRQTRRTFLAVAGTIAVAGCMGDGGTDGGATPTTTPTATTTMGDDSEDGSGNDGGETSATVAVRSHADLGEILVDGAGTTLYMFDSDSRGDGASTCYDQCADAWPPLTAEEEPTATDGVTADLSTFERDDGTSQVAADGWPLYYYAADESPGDAQGQGANDVWWVLAPDGTPKKPAATPTATEGSGGDGGDGGDGGVY